MLVGRIAGAFGLRGELKVEPLTDFPERFATGARLFVGPGWEPQVVAGSRPHKSHILLTLVGIDTVEAAEELRGRDIAVPRTEATPLPPGHYYLDQLAGIEVVTVTGEPVGRVSDVLRTGSNDVYVVESAGRELLIPGTRDAVAELDVSKRRMVVEPWVLSPPR